jgi:hypothetical protein
MRRRTRRNARVPARFLPSMMPLEDRRLLSTDVLTYHYDNARSGLNANETTLTPANVNAASFGKVGFDAVDGKVDAQPLLRTGVAIPGQGTHDVLYVATENDRLYAFDAASGVLLWKVSMLGPGEVPSDPVNGTQVIPTIGITDTPVIDPNTGVMYLVAMSKRVSGGSTTYIQRIHAVSIATGLDVVPPKSIDQSITFPGAGPGGNGSRVSFDPRQYEERDALLLSNGVVYTGWASHSDVAPYTGWLIGFNASNLAVASILNIDPNGSPRSSILEDGSGNSFWNSGGGPAADAAGNLYNLSANGPFDPNLNAAGFPSNGDFGDSFLKFTPTPGGIIVSDYFTPQNQQDEANNDEDLGSSGLTLVHVVDASGTPHQLAIGSGKDGNIYVVDTANMGKFSPTRNNIYQELPGAVGGGEFSSPVAFDGRVYFGGVGATLRAFSFVGGKLQATPTSQTANKFAYPGTNASISSNGNADGIAWAIGNDNQNGPAVLYAYDAANLAHMLYSSNQAANGRDVPGIDNKFITPVVANGRVYVATTDGVAVYALLAPPTPPVTPVPPVIPIPPVIPAPPVAPAPTVTPVNLAGSFNRTGIAVDGVAFAGGGLDGHGNALSSNRLGPTVNAAGVTFVLGPAGSNDVVSSTGQTIALPSNNFGSLKLLVTAVNGNQPRQTFIVTYTDGTQARFTRSVSAWNTPQHFAGESIAASTNHRDTSMGRRQGGTFRVYVDSLPLDPNRQVLGLTLPGNGNVELLAAELVPSGTTQVGLGGLFNRSGIVADGSTFGGGFDGHGNSFSANLLGPIVTAAGVAFVLGPANANDVISSARQAIALPRSSFGSLKLLAAAVGGNQANQPFLITYTDGTRVTVKQSISDWRTPRGFAGESIAATTPYRDTSNGGRQGGAFRVYAYTIALDPTRTVRSLTLPNNRNVEVLGVDLTA